MPLVDVVRTYLELDTPEALRPAPAPGADERYPITRLDPCSVAESRALYHLVGERWHWRDRDAWTDESYAHHLAGVEVWVMRDGESPAGFFEIGRDAEGGVEIILFGVADGWQGRGLGAHLLTRAVERGWAMGASRVWLHTCTLDSPRALPNYLARGFREVRREEYQAEVAADPR